MIMVSYSFPRNNLGYFIFRQEWQIQIGSCTRRYSLGYFFKTLYLLSVKINNFSDGFCKMSRFLQISKPVNRLSRNL